MRISYGKNLEYSFDINTDDFQEGDHLIILCVTPKGVELGEGNPDFSYSIRRK